MSAFSPNISSLKRFAAPPPCFPLRVGFACFITDCSVSFIFLIFAFDVIPCFPLFRFFSIRRKSEKTYGSGESGERMRADRGLFQILALFQGFPPGGGSLRSKVVRGARFFEPAFLYTVFSIAKTSKIVSRFAASHCLKKNSANFIFFGKNVKPCLTSRLPRGGKLSTSLTDEGRPLLRTGCFKQFSQKNSTVFIGSKKAPCFSQDAFHIKSLIPLYFPQYHRRFPSFLPRFPQAFLPSRTRRCSYRR